MVDTGPVDAGRATSREVGHYGVPATGLTVTAVTIATAWNVQGDATRPDFVEGVRRLFDVVLPAKANTTARSDALTALWLGPKSWLLAAGGASPLNDFVAKRDALNQQGGALFDVSASRIAWAIAGPRAATVLAKGCPLDFHPRAFAVGACAQSVYGHVNVLVEKRDETPTFTLMVGRSFARDVDRALGAVALQYGFDVLAARPYG
ncbi:MAG TPA: sarcosine oxidase subunit gamma family protein [Casimicrobiaceae bacterium]|nr:sarcosine oxidase subunit gamma family protein [Casimicrobiaceae bacterium]